MLISISDSITISQSIDRMAFFSLSLLMLSLTAFVSCSRFPSSPHHSAPLLFYLSFFQSSEQRELCNFNTNVQTSLFFSSAFPPNSCVFPSPSSSNVLFSCYAFLYCKRGCVKKKPFFCMCMCMCVWKEYQCNDVQHFIFI